MLNNLVGHALEVLLVVTLGAVLVVWVRTLLTSRKQILVDDIVNTTGRGDLDAVCRGLSVHLRQQIKVHLDATRRKKGELLDEPDGDKLPLLETMEVTQRSTDDSLTALFSSLQAGSPRSMAIPLQEIRAVVVRPRGSSVTAALQNRSDPGRGGEIFGISVNLAEAKGRHVAGHVFWEPGAPPDEGLSQGRLAALVAPACRWVALELSASEQLRRLRKAAGRRGRGENLTTKEAYLDNETGLLYQASAYTFPGHENDFMALAVTRLEAAIAKCAGQHAFYENLGDTYRLWAALREPDKARLCARAVAAYTQGIAAADRNIAAGTVPQERRYQIEESLALAQLLSGLPALQERGGRYLRELPADRITSDALHHRLYNGACLYALGHRHWPEQEHWDRRARALLGAAILRDKKETLWGVAGTDDDLAGLAEHLNEFETELLAMVSQISDRAAVTAAEIDEMVALCGERTGWIAAARAAGPDGISPETARGRSAA